MLRSSPCVGITNEFEAMRIGSFGGTVGLRSIKVTGYKVCLSLDGSSLLQLLDELKELRNI